MGFWNKLNPFRHSPEEEAKLAEFTAKLEQDLKSQTASEITQMQENYAQRIAQLQEYGNQVLQQTVERCYADAEEKTRILKQLGMSSDSAKQGLENLQEILDKNSRL